MKGLTEGQKKLPKALQDAILAKQKKMSAKPTLKPAKPKMPPRTTRGKKKMY